MKLTDTLERAKSPHRPFPLRLRLLELLDDLDFAIGGGGNAGGAGSSGIAGIGIGSTHSSSSRSAGVGRYHTRKVYYGRLNTIRGDVAAGAGAGRHGTEGSSSVPPPLWPLSEAAHKEIRSPMRGPSPASKKSSEEFSPSSLCVSSPASASPSPTTSPSPSPFPPPTPKRDPSQ